MRGLVSKVEGGCMYACFHMASRARTRAAESYGMAVSLGKAKVHISRIRLVSGGNFPGFWKDVFRGDLTGFSASSGFDRSWIGFERGI